MGDAAWHLGPFEQPGPAGFSAASASDVWCGETMRESLRVLLVDDDPHDRRLVRETLEQAFAALPLAELAEPAAGW